MAVVASTMGVAMSATAKRFLTDEQEATSAPMVAESLPKIPAMTRHMVRCGRSNCRCAAGLLHESWRLVWRGLDGRQHYRYVRKAELNQVRAILTERRQERAAERVLLDSAFARIREIERWVREHELEQ